MKDLDREEYEHIPWSQLTSEMQSPYRRPAFVVLGVVVAVVLGLVASRVLAGGGPAPEPPPAAAPVTTGAQPTTPATTSPVPPPQLYREADLLAILPKEESRFAAVTAEWFITDHFTVDGSDHGDRAAGQTYVEWARAFRVDASDPERFVVDVVFRMLASGGDGRFFRLPLRAAEVGVVRTGDGELAVEDLPAPIRAPSPGQSPVWPEGGEVPAEVAAVVRAELSELGIDGEVVSGHEVAGGWRVVVRAALGAGPAFPMVMSIDGDAARP